MPDIPASKYDGGDNGVGEGRERHQEGGEGGGPDPGDDEGGPAQDVGGERQEVNCCCPSLLPSQQLASAGESAPHIGGQ